jgi:hypothetical protein
MEFEHSGHYADEYPYIIVFEKLSFGVFQYLLDFIVNLVFGWISVSESRFNTPDITGGGGSPDFTLLQSFASNMNQQVSLSDIGIPPEVIQNIASSVGRTSINGADLGNIVQTVSDSEQDVTNIPGKYSISSIIDENQDWYDIPFLDTFPQKFSFAIGDKTSVTEVSITNLNDSGAIGSNIDVSSIQLGSTKTKQIYTMSFTVVDTIFEDDNSPRYSLRIVLNRNGIPIYAGLLNSGTEYVFDGILAIYIKNFNMSVNSDGYLSHTISGMVARID